MYTYKDIITDEIKRTRGEFIGWTDLIAPLNIKYAIFRNRVNEVLVPDYLLTRETLDRINKVV